MVRRAGLAYSSLNVRARGLAQDEDAPGLGDAMPYYFHVFLRGQAILDPEGSEIPTDEEARAEAKAIAGELQHEFPDKMGNCSFLEIVSEHGVRVGALPIR